MKTVFALLAALVATVASHAAPADSPRFELEARSPLYTTTAEGLVKHPCQPREGERLVLLGIDPRPTRREAALVRVESGSCRGTEGWISLGALSVMKDIDRPDPAAQPTSAAASTPGAKPWPYPVRVRCAFFDYEKAFGAGRQASTNAASSSEPAAKPSCN